MRRVAGLQVDYGCVGFFRDGFELFVCLDSAKRRRQFRGPILVQPVTNQLRVVSNFDESASRITMLSHFVSCRMTAVSSCNNNSREATASARRSVSSWATVSL